MSKHFWKGKSAVICGATAGLGKSIACELAAAGVANLALLARRSNALEKLQGELTHCHPTLRVTIHSVDLCDRQQVTLAAKQILTKLGKMDLLVQAVGKSDRGTLRQLHAERLQGLLDVNLMSSLNAIQGFEAGLRKPGGRIVLIGSLASLFAPRFLGGYAIVKHALAGLAQQARLELAEDGLHVLLACPGPIARDDAGRRYQSAGNELDLPPGPDVPAEAMRPGAGAKLRGLDSNRLAREILSAAAKSKRVIIRPRSARVLLVLAAISPRLGDYLLTSKSS